MLTGVVKVVDVRELLGVKAPRKSSHRVVRRVSAATLGALVATTTLLIGTMSSATADAAQVSPDPGVSALSPRSIPLVGDCTYTSSWGPFVTDGGLVDCAEDHTGVTVYVGRWASHVSPARADAMPYAKRDRVVDQLRWEINACDEARTDYLGLQLTPTTYRESQFYVHITGPNPQQWEAGERWLRCDIVAFKHPRSWEETANSWLNLPTRLQLLPSPKALRGFLARPDLGSFTNCQAQRDGSGWYEMFACNKGIEIVASVDLPRDFPSIDATRKHVEKQCVSVVKRITGRTVERGDVVALSSGCASVASAWVCGLRRR